METPPSLTEIFAEIPDPRSASGRRYSLSAILNLAAVAMLAGMRSLESIAPFARDHGTSLTHALGFHSANSPCKATFSNVFRDRDVALVEAALARWILARCPDLGDQLCLDGKTARGSKNNGTPGIHLLAAYAPHVAAVVAQIQVDRKTNEHKAALELLGVLPLAGTVVTGDAMFCQKDACRAVDDGGGDYLFAVKDNQPTLHFDIACLFAESVNFSPYHQKQWASEQDACTTSDKGHGRVEKRTLTATPALPKHLSEWPGIAQVFQIQRERRFSNGRVETETAYGITSLTPPEAGAARLLTLNRTHRSIENKRHWVRDVVFGEDACRVRTAGSPQLLAAIRNSLTHLLATAKVQKLAAALRRFAVRPLEGLELLRSLPKHETEN